MTTWSTPRTWTAGEIPTAAIFNQYVRDQQRVLSEAWTAFTPTWTGATTNPVLGNGTFDAGYSEIGKWIRFRINLTMGSTTTYGSGAWFFSLPATPLNFRWLFTGVARDISLNNSYAIGVEYDTTLPMRLRQLNASPMTTITSTTPFTWATGDTVFLSGAYETT